MSKRFFLLFLIFILLKYDIFETKKNIILINFTYFFNSYGMCSLKENTSYFMQKFIRQKNRRIIASRIGKKTKDI